MDSLLTTLHSPATSDYGFQPTSDLDFSNLFEQCGIPLADLGAQISSVPIPSPTSDSSSTTWYSGTAPADGDIVELEADRRIASSVVLVHDPNEQQRIAEKSIDGSGNDTVSTFGGEAHVPVSLQYTQKDEAAERRSPSAWAEHHRLRASSGSPGHSSRTSEFKSSAKPKRSPSPLAASALKTPWTPIDKHIDLEEQAMDFYAQQQMYSAPQLSSPISMKSSPCEHDAYLYTPDFSPDFSTYAGSELAMGSAPTDSELMRRSRSTPFLGQRTADMVAPTMNTSYDSSVYLDMASYEEVVPASSNGAWERNGSYLLPRQKAGLYDAGHGLPMSAPRPTMKRKNRPIPIATSLSHSAGSMGAQTAPLERVGSMAAPQLSAKRSFEDFTDLDAGLVNAAPYRPVSTPMSKRSRSALPASPYMDEPLFSPLFATTNGLALSMDPEQCLLASPPYNHTDFCSSPSYLSSTPTTLDPFSVPNTIVQQGSMFSNQEPLSPLDLDNAWAQKQMYSASQRMVQPMYTTPRTLNYGQVSPLRKTVPKLRKPAVARAISFCNYTAADKKTILSGVAPSGSNKKIVTKPQEMSRSSSSGAISAV